MASMHVILSSRDGWAVVKDAKVTEKVQTGSIMDRKSRVEMVMCYEVALMNWVQLSLYELWY